MTVNTQPTEKDLRTFGLILVPFVAVFGFVLSHRFGDAVGRAVWIGGGALAAVYLAVPPTRRAIFVGWGRATYPIGFVVSNLLLGFVFYVVVTPIALLLRVLGKDPLERRVDPAASSYWVERQPGDRPVRRYFQQF